MSEAHDFDGSWERVAAELRPCKESQQKAYGDVDSATLGRYLAGEMTSAELASLEQTLADLPELRKLTDLVQDVLGDLEPIEAAPPVPSPVPVPNVLPMRAARPRRKPSWIRRYAPVAAAACLLVTVATLMPKPAFLSGPRPESRLVLSAHNGTATYRDPAELAGLENRMVWLDAPAGKGLGGAVADTVAPALPTAPAGGTAQLSPQQLNQAVTFYHAQGETGRAEKTLRHGYLACKKELGPDHKATKWAARQLAGVYQFALNDSEPMPAIAPVAIAPRSEAPDCPRSRARNTARLVRDKLHEQPANKVRETVAPVLAEALRNADDPHERLALIRALGELGPGARPAVGMLCERLKKADDASERLAILFALKQMGSAAHEAAPTLAALVPPSSSALTFKADEKKDVVHAKADSYHLRSSKLTAVEQKLARQVLARLSGRDERIGVIDSAGLFTVKSTLDGNRTARSFANESDLEVRVETSDSKRPADPMLARMGQYALHVVLSDGGKSAQVHVSPAMKESGLDAVRLRKQLDECCCKGDHEQALRAVIAAARQVKVEQKKK